MMMYCLLSKNFITRLVRVLSCLLFVFSFKPVLGQENNNAKVHYPANVSECIKELKSTLPSKGGVIEEFKSHPAEIANDCHFTLGMWIRNNWIHCGDGVLMTYFEKMGIYHPDDMSAIILDSLWRDLHSLPINLKEQVDKCNNINSYNDPMVREKRLIPADIWNRSLSLNNGNVLKLSDLKGKVIVLLLFAYDIVSPSAVVGLDVLQDKFSKGNVSVIGLHDGAFDPKHEQSYIANKSTTFPLIAVESEFIWRIQHALISPGALGFPQIILIERDGNMIVRFNEWDADVESKKMLCDEIQAALNASPQL